MSGSKNLECKLNLLQCKVLVHRRLPGCHRGYLARGGHPSPPPRAGIGGPAYHTRVRNCTQVEALPNVNIHDKSAVGAVGIAYETDGEQWAISVNSRDLPMGA